MNKVVIKVTDIVKSFHVGTQDIVVLKGVSFEIKKGEFMVLFGPSGCGKSTLLHTILGLEPPTEGSISILDTNLYKDKQEDEISEFRKQHIGMVYQQPNWIKSLNVIKNVAFPLLLVGLSKAESFQKAEKMLKTVNMLEWADYFPSELSSGQQQRVSLARALITDPEIIIADEPTGNLDYNSGQDLMKLLLQFCKEDKTILMVTHDLEYLKFAQKAIEMFDGKILKIHQTIDKKLLSSIRSKRGDDEISK